MLKAIELWHVPLLSAGAILIGSLAFTFIARRATRITASRIRVVGVLAIVVVALFLSYRLVDHGNLSVIVGLVTLAFDGVVAWVAMEELKELRLAKQESEAGQRTAGEGRVPAG
jgi:hypothetical protein